MQKSWAFLLLTVALFIGINAPTLFSEGMFMDGLFYSTISRNLAEGNGSFWDLYYTATYNQHFHGHPPLAIGLQALFYLLFGDYLWVEQLYSLTTNFISIFLMYKIWLLLTSKKTIQYIFWFPILLYSIVGVVGWAVANNMLENTMTVFVLLSFYFSLLAIQNKIRWHYIILSGLSIFLAFLTKGAVGIFPLVTFFIFGIFRYKIDLKQGVFYSILQLIGFLMPFVFLYLFVPQAIQSLNDYYHAQIVHSLTKVNITGNRFWILKSLLQQLLPVLILSSVLYFSFKNKIRLYFTKEFFLLICIGLAGVLPIMISLKQRDFYIISSFPFFALAIAFYLSPIVLSIQEKIINTPHLYKRTKIIALFISITSITIALLQINRIGRDAEIIADIKTIGTVVPKEQVIIIPSNLSQNWALRGYFARYYSIALTTDTSYATPYYLSNKNTFVPPNKKQLELNLYKFNLYKNK